MWEIVHPRCARARADDIAEVRHIIEMGETEIAIDELRWLLNGCGDFVDAHRLLGELALVDHEIRLARGHFGYAYEIGIAAIDRAGSPAPFPYVRAANQSFLESAKGLAHCLIELNKPQLALDVLKRLLRLDPTDPLAAQAMMKPLAEDKRG